MSLKLPGCLGVDGGGGYAFMAKLLPYFFNVMGMDIEPGGVCVS